jgi:mRNA interferase RelE/StbE
MASFRVEVTGDVRKELRNAPGHIRAQILEVLHALESSHNPPGSWQLDLAALTQPLAPTMSLWRVRIGAWRVIYVADVQDQAIYVLALRHRPPYQYEDLDALIRQLR